MTNHKLRDIINVIEKTDGLTVSEIAKTADIDRSHLSTTINEESEKLIGKKMLSKLKTAFPSYFQESNKTNSDGNYLLPIDDIKITLADYIRKIEDHNKYLQESVMANLNLALGYMGKMDTQSEAARKIVLESLSRLEKKPEGSLNDEADKEALRIIEERKRQGIAVGKHK